MKTKEFEYQGYDSPVVNFSTNDLDVYSLGKENIKFANTESDISFNNPTLNIQNLIVGVKEFYFSGKFFIWDESNNLFCEYQFKNDLPKKTVGGFLGFGGKEEVVDRDLIM
jgi:hypothetical protein